MLKTTEHMQGYVQSDLVHLPQGQVNRLQKSVTGLNGIYSHVVLVYTYVRIMYDDATGAQTLGVRRPGNW